MWAMEERTRKEEEGEWGLREGRGTEIRKKTDEKLREEKRQ